MNDGKHTEKRKQRSPWAWLVSKIGKVGAIVTVLVLVVAMAAAVAAILASAEIEGSTGTGQVALDWELGTGGDGALTGLSAEYVTPGGVIDGGGAVPVGHTCAGSISGGVLTLDVDGLFPGEGCVLENISVTNGSSLDVGTFLMTYAANYGTDASGEEVELWIAAFTGGAYNAINLAGLADLGPGATYGATGGVSADNWVLIVELPATSTADGSSHDATGTALQGSTP